MKYQKTLATAGGSEILAVIEGLPVSANGFFLTEAQMDKIDAALVAADTTVSSLQTTTAQLATAVTAKDTAEASLQTANARIAVLEKQDGKIPTAAHAAEEKKDVIAIDDAKAFETPYDREMAAYYSK